MVSGVANFFGYLFWGLRKNAGDRERVEFFEAGSAPIYVVKLHPPPPLLFLLFVDVCNDDET